MKHDELLGKIMNKRATVYEDDIAVQLADALRAIVELHKPRESTRTQGVPNSEGVSIGAAEPSCDAAGCREEYPCSTIQAIEKELA
jgi:hypothetical protein